MGARHHGCLQVDPDGATMVEVIWTSNSLDLIRRDRQKCTRCPSRNRVGMSASPMRPACEEPFSSGGRTSLLEEWRRLEAGGQGRLPAARHHRRWPARPHAPARSARHLRVILRMGILDDHGRCLSPNRLRVERHDRAEQAAHRHYLLHPVPVAAARRLDGAGTAFDIHLRSWRGRSRSGLGRVFQIDYNDVVIWERQKDGGFPDVKTLKQRVRDQLDPGRSLGHVDRT
jgi:hypothetical protein